MLTRLLSFAPAALCYAAFVANLALASLMNDFAPLHCAAAVACFVCCALNLPK